MRRALTAVLTMVLTTGLGMVGLATAPAASAKPKLESTRTVRAPVDIWTASAAQTPGGPPDYCAVTIFVVFGDLEGYEPTSVDYTYTANGVTDAYSDSLAAPYSDVFTWGPLSRNAPPGKHQAVLGGQPFVWVSGSPDCSEPSARAAAGFEATAEVTYQATDKCQAAMDGYQAADRVLKRAKKALDKATTRGEKVAAAAKVRSARAKLARAKKRYQRTC